MSLLTIVQEASGLIGVPEPVSVASSSDVLTRRLFRLANQAGRELARWHDWQNLITLRQYTTIAQQEQTGAIPADDYGRMVYNPEIWDTSANQRLTGPTPQRYRQILRNGVAIAGPGYWWLQENELNVLPIMAAGHEITFEYVSKRWARTSTGTPKEAFTADSDAAAVPEELVVLEIIWRFQQSQGLAQYAESLKTCEMEKERVASSDRASGRIRTESLADMPAGHQMYYGHVIS